MNISGVIFVVLALLWGILLVPALVRKHDTVTEVRSVDRFSYALRVLSRRTPFTPGRRDVVVPRKSAQARRPVISPAPGFVAAGSERSVATARVARDRVALAAKRRHNLIGLSLTVVACLGLAFRSGGQWWLTVAITGLVMAMYVAHLRTEAEQLAQIQRRRAQARRRATRLAASQAGAQAARRAAGRSVATATAIAAEPMPATATWSDGSWAPVPVTLPTYVTKPVVSAPPVPPPTGVWYDGVLAEQRAARFAAGGDVYDQMSDDDHDYLGLGRGSHDQDGLIAGDGLDAIIERRRAVND